MAVRSKVDPVTSARARAVPFTAAGVALLLAMAAIDLLVYFGFSLAFAYPGVLFLLNAGAAVVIAAVLVRGYAVAWHAGALLAASTAVLFVVVRTTGLPGFQLSDWIFTLGILPLGPLSLVAEALFCGLYVSWLTSVRISRRLTSIGG